MIYFLTTAKNQHLTHYVSCTRHHFTLHQKMILKNHKDNFLGYFFTNENLISLENNKQFKTTLTF